ncbi:MAG: hypothetical protein NDJ94_04590 [Vicinamibacteria bacterium]|nr:hypothetical protein [Vicinamibacteria bacterium]
MVPSQHPGSRNALIALFVAAISLPLMANLAGFHGGDEEAENRRMAPFPLLEASWGSIAAFPEGFVAWFEDEFGFRSTLVRWAGQVRYFGLGVSPSPEVVRGEDGWLFYGGDSGLEDYARESAFTQDELQTWRETLTRSRRWLAARDAAFVFTIAPDKHVVYPEHWPPALRPVGARYRMDELFDVLRGTDVAAVDLRPALAAAKPGEQLYEKTDTHWNERGAFVAYQQLIAAIRLQQPAVPPAWSRADFAAVRRDERAMDLAAMIGLRDVLREQRLLLEPRRPRQARVVEPAGGEAWWNVGRLVTEIPGSTLPRAVVFRDSFGSRLAPFLSEHFSRVVYLWQVNFDAEVVAQERADVVIQEIASRKLLVASPWTNAE